MASENDLHPNSLACLSTNGGQVMWGRIGAATLSVNWLTAAMSTVPYPLKIFLPLNKVKYTEFSLCTVGCSFNGSFSQRENETELNLIKFHLLQKSKCLYLLHF